MEDGLAQEEAEVPQRIKVVLLGLPSTAPADPLRRCIAPRVSRSESGRRVFDLRGAHYELACHVLPDDASPAIRAATFHKCDAVVYVLRADGRCTAEGSARDALLDLVSQSQVSPRALRLLLCNVWTTGGGPWGTIAVPELVAIEEMCETSAARVEMAAASARVEEGRYGESAFEGVVRAVALRSRKELRPRPWVVPTLLELAGSRVKDLLGCGQLGPECLECLPDDLRPALA
eukprot:m51a1_g788 hypothetical protein (233) ;mRNA; f:628933-629851